MPLGLIRATAVRYLFSCQTEQKEIFFAGFFSHLNGRAVTRADGQRSVHHELHIAGATCFVAGRGNLIGDIRRGNEPLGHGNTVIGQEQNLEPSADHRIGVDRVSDVIDKLNYYLRQLVGRRRFASEKESAWRRLEICGSREADYKARRSEARLVVGACIHVYA